MIRLCAALVAVLAAYQGSRPPELSVRFHHVHYSVGDPSATMSDAARKLGAVRVIVPGLGVGVRVQDEYLLFDRDDTGASTNRGSSATAIYAASASWLAQRGLVVTPPGGDSLRAVTAFASERIEHVAFVTDDLPATLAHLNTRGAVAVRTTEDAALFDAGGGVFVEIVRDVDRADTHWCPMHPDERAPDARKCRLCGMDLVPIPPPAIGEHRIDVALEPAARGRGLRGLRLTVRDPATDAPVTRFATVHEKVFHVFVVGRDLQYFAHVHPEARPDGTFVLAHAVPPGEYMLFADFLPEGGRPQMVQKAIISPGRSRRRAAALDDLPRTVTTAGITVSLDAGEGRAGKELPMTFTVMDAATKVPVTDLQPYLGAPAHMLIVRDDLTDAVHAHPEERTTGGPSVTFHPLIPAAGTYRLWIQFQRGRRVITVPFALRAER